MFFRDTLSLFLSLFSSAYLTLNSVNKCILIIDDDDDIRDVTRASLEIMAGFRVITASSGEGGIQKATHEQPDAILLDVVLSDADGIMIFQQLQNYPATSHIPVILLTAKTQWADQVVLTQLGVSGVIIKPFKPAVLAQQIKTILGWG